jgi:hypothetical protein
MDGNDSFTLNRSYRSGKFGGASIGAIRAIYELEDMTFRATIIIGPVRKRPKTARGDGMAAQVFV